MASLRRASAGATATAPRLPDRAPKRGLEALLSRVKEGGCVVLSTQARRKAVCVLQYVFAVRHSHRSPPSAFPHAQQPD